MTNYKKDSEFFQFKRLYELNRGDVFKITIDGVFYSVLIKNESSMLIQTKYGKRLRNYQKTDLDIEVLFYPERN